MNSGDIISGFTLDSTENIKELSSDSFLFTHNKTKAKVLHIKNKDPNNLFCVAFKTPVFDDTGVPHILEHSVLSGSKKFPLKDPFKEMLKGSLQTFLNAMTYPDRTLYPVSSQVEKDYFNLANVYCDAVFFPLLEKETFLQEGWHLDVPEKDGELSIKGIVYNEMKGVFSDFTSHVARKTMSALMPDTTYFYESGGEPKDIPNLTYEAFKDFHSRYYHPSNAQIFLYGDIPTEKTLEFLDSEYLNKFDFRDPDSNIEGQKLWSVSKTLDIKAPSAKEDDGKATVLLSWIYGDSKNALERMTGRIITSYLLSKQASPLKRALIDSGFGEDLDDMCGLEGDLKQLSFSVGLKKCNPENKNKIKDLIFETLKNEVKNGMDSDLLEGCIRQTEFSLREINDSGHSPYNIRLATKAYASWIYGGNPLAHLKFEDTINKIKDKKKEGTKYFEDIIKEKLIDNPHLLHSTITASASMGESLGKLTEDHSKEISKTISSAEKEKAHIVTKELLLRQNTPNSPEVINTLPRLNKSDLPPKELKTESKKSTIQNVEVYNSKITTSGIIYLDLGFDARNISDELLPYLLLYSKLISRSGADGISFSDFSKQLSLSTGGLSCSRFSVAKLENPNDLISKMFFHTKCLEDRLDETLELFKKILLKPELDNTKQIKDLVFEMKNDLYSAITGSGHLYATGLAAASLSNLSALSETISGVTQYRFLEKIIKNEDYKKVADSLLSIHNLLINKDAALLSITSEEPDNLKDILSDFISTLPSKKIFIGEYSPSLYTNENIGIEISSSVNYVAKTWALPKLDATEIGLCSLITRILSTGYLWDKVRVEGGAYGGMAFNGSANPIISMASYRDPNIAKTFDNFINALEFLSKEMEEEELDQSIIGLIGKFDAPSSPHARCYSNVLDIISERDYDFRQKTRDSILKATPNAILNMVKQISKFNSSNAVIGSSVIINNKENSICNLNIQTLSN